MIHAVWLRMLLATIALFATLGTGQPIKLCTEKTPPILTSTCDPDDYLCKTITFVDDKTIHCGSATVLYKSAIDNKETVVSGLKCDTSRGVWFFDQEGEEVEEVEDEKYEENEENAHKGNIVCRYEDCDIFKLCPLCEKDTNSLNKYRCPADHTVEVTDQSSTDPQLLTDSARLVCKLGKWERETGSALADSTFVTCQPNYKCTVKTPLTLSCGSDDCEEIEIELSDDVSIDECDSLVYTSSTDQKEYKASELACDRTRGIWKMEEEGGREIDIDQAGNLECIYRLCTENTPLTSTCSPDDYLCETITLADTEANQCASQSATLVYKSTDQTENNTGAQLKCDTSTGNWLIESEDVEASNIYRQGNIVCRHEDCDISKICPLCEKESGSPNKFRCPTDHTVEVIDSSSTDMQVLPDSARFVCKLGKWERETGSALADSTIVSCQSGLSPVSYVAISVALLLVLLILIFLALGLSGRGWMHKIILSKLRGGKGKDVTC